ncbi:VanZ family protein [Propionicimonas paludicola]|uniref:VanZ family protein n=1 Tax=Propionicimonas paludicola TaxID=185243 RepID=UPI001474B045|nr:VanZ family protein [Propionicimonas paludicola]
MTAIRIDRSESKGSVGSARGLLVIYLVILALIGFWPTPVDRAAGSFLLWLGRVVPMLSYTHLEFGANVLLFVPLGLLVTRMLRVHRYLSVVVGLLASVGIELVQWLALPARTPSLYDVLANTLGACLGLLIALWWERGRAHSNGAADR